MNILIRRLSVLGMVIMYTGCGGEPEPLPPRVDQQETPPAAEYVPMPSSPILGAETPDSAVPGIDEPAPAIDGSQPAAADPPANPPEPPSLPASPPPARPPQSPAAPAIDLSAGVALPQSLPTGTAMGMSVDYVFTAGEPLPSQRYVWVIEPAMGDPLRQPVQLSSRGTLQAFFPRLHPRNGPFRTHIESPDGSRVSASVSLE